MTEEHVAHLYKIAYVLPKANQNVSQVLQSYYLMKCHDISKNQHLPTKQFSSVIRCAHCCIDWKTGSYVTKIRSNKYSKRKRKNNKVLKPATSSKQLERTCSFCQKITIIPIENNTKSIVKQKEKEKKATSESKDLNTNKRKLEKVKPESNPTINVYNRAKEVFSLSNEKNAIDKSCNIQIKPIKNNKRKKDKFAGLCKEAVLASAKIAKTDLESNKLNLFLKKSS